MTTALSQLATAAESVYKRKEGPVSEYASNRARRFTQRSHHYNSTNKPTITTLVTISNHKQITYTQSSWDIVSFFDLEFTHRLFLEVNNFKNHNASKDVSYSFFR
jgi:hypothetical protein